MSSAKQEITKTEIKPGMTVRVHEMIKEKTAKGVDRERVQIFEGVVLLHKHGQEAGATITVRKISDGVGVEKVYPIHSPIIKKIELVKSAKVRRAKLTHLRQAGHSLKEAKK